jgi:asparagine synthase (glutamine-hydrolysing)
MCGIAGWVSTRGPIDVAIVRSMTDVLHHRGPDDAGYLIDDGAALRTLGANGVTTATHAHAGSPDGRWAGLGHRRLAILDLSLAGHQPMSDPGRRYWLTYNGEIYNFVELRTELRARGWRFVSDSDTEVVLAGYVVWGESCVERFNGMWAFAIWDAQERRLFCARDRMGVKPFYFFHDDGHFIFASELKALLVNPLVPRDLNETAVREFLVSGSIDHRPGQTLLSRVAELPAAHTLRLDAGGVQTREYWRLEPTEEKRPFDARLIEQCRDLLLDATRVRLRSDVPVGGTLSGGIDSATLTCLVDQFCGLPNYPVFTVQFPGHAQDESRYVRDVVAESRALQLHTLTPSADDLLGDLQRVLWHQDEPFADTSIFAHYRIMQLVRDEGVKVVLTGQGADEIFAGYASYYSAYLGHLAATAQVGTLGREIRARSRSTGESAAGLLRSALYHATPAGIRSRVHARVAGRTAPWLKPGASTPPRFVAPPDGWSGFDWYLHESLRKWAIPHLLRQDDRNSMAFSIESRAPFMDYRLVELLFSTEDGAKVGGGESKRLLRAAGMGVVPASVSARRDKIGFYTPMTDWLRDSRDLVQDVLSSDFASSNPFFDAAPLRSAADAMFRGDRRHVHAVWMAFCLTLWHHTVVEQSYHPATAAPVSARKSECA